MASLAVDAAALQPDCSAALAGSAAAASRLWAALYPGAVGQFLRTTEAPALVLLLPSAVDFLPWEMAADAGRPIGERMAVSRRLLGDPDGGLPVTSQVMLPVADPHAGPLRLLGVGIDLQALTATAPAARWLARSVSAEQGSGEEAGELLATHDVVVFSADAALLHAAPWPMSLGQPAPRLLVCCGVASATRCAFVQAAARFGSAVVCVDRYSLPLIAQLLSHLQTGMAVGEAVRRLRVDSALSAAARAIVLYAPADDSLFRLAADPEPPAASLRQVTTLSFDLVGSTALLHRLGEERYSLVLESLHATCAAAVQRHGGVSDDPQGDDGVMSYFGYPEASESAADQAVAAGLDIVQAVRPLGVQVRVGVATGRVAVRRGQPVGVSIHLAARLQGMAEPGCVLVAGSTRALLGQRFDLSPLEHDLVLKGIPDPTAVYAVIGRRPSDQTVAAAATPTAFVGRDAEIAALAQEWEAVLGGATRVVLVVGEAGIGKSRLVGEFRRGLMQGGQLVIECRGREHASRTAFGALTDTLRRLLNLQSSDSPEQQQQKIESGMPAGIADSEAVRWLRTLLGVADTAPPPEADNPQRHRARTLAVLLDWFRRTLGALPVCLVVEDAHWLDPSSREFLTRLLAEPGDLHMLLLVAQRNEGVDFWRPPQLDSTLQLQRLSAVAARWLARKACGDASLPQDLLRLLAARSDGVPLFIEESVRMALDAGAGAAESMHPMRLVVPPTLRDLLMARLDQLATARPVAQLAAALGREFPQALLQATLAHGSQPMALDGMQARLRELEAAGLLVRKGDDSAPTWAFKHALMCDTAYHSLWESDRCRVHRDVAAVLAQRFPALVDHQPELLARHQTAAGMDAEALVQWERAARRASAGSAHEEAVGHIDCALLVLKRLPAGRPRDRTELRLLLLLASRCIATEGYGAVRVERLYARAADLCRLLGDESALLKVELGQHGWHFMRGDLDRAQAIASRCETTALRSAEPMQQLQASWAVAITQFHRGESLPAVARMDAGLRQYRSDMHRSGAVQDPGVMCLCYSAWAQWELGHVADALSRVQRVVELATLLGHRFSLAEAHGFACSVHLFCGHTEQALEHAQQSMALCEEGGFVVWHAHALVMRGRLRCDLGAVEQGLADMDEGHAMWVGTGAVVTLPLYLTMRAEGQALAGRPAQGLALLAEARALIERTGERYHEPEVLRLTGDLMWQAAEAGAGSAAAAVEAESWLRRAITCARQQHKRSFGLRAAQSLARLCMARGEPGAAAALVQAALNEMPATGEPVAAAELQSPTRGMRREPVGSSIAAGDAP